jgi:hypothetical protein
MESGSFKITSKAMLERYTLSKAVAEKLAREFKFANNSLTGLTASQKSQLATKLIHKSEAGLTPEEKAQKLDLAPIIAHRLKVYKKSKLVTVLSQSPDVHLSPKQQEQKVQLASEIEARRERNRTSRGRRRRG